MARRWWWAYVAVVTEGGCIGLCRYVWRRQPDQMHATQAGALSALSEELEDGVRQRLNQIDAIRAGKVTRTWEKRK